MPNQQITSTIVYIVIWLISAFATLIFRKIFEPYIPERKKLISYIKKFLFLIAAYILPIGVIVYLMIKTVTVDKHFVFSITFSFVSLAINYNFYLHSLSLNSAIKVKDAHESVLDGMIGLVNDSIGLIESMNIRIKHLEDKSAEKQKN